MAGALKMPAPMTIPTMIATVWWSSIVGPGCACAGESAAERVRLLMGGRGQPSFLRGRVHATRSDDESGSCPTPGAVRRA